MVTSILSYFPISIKNKLQPVAKLYPMSFEILIFIPLLLIRYHLLFAVHVDLNRKKVIDSHLILEE